MPTASANIIDLARAHIAGMPQSIEGQQGSTSLLNVARELVVGFDLSESEAFPLLLAWNQNNARPPWSQREILHKLKDAAKSNARRGYRLPREKEAENSTTAQIDKEMREKREGRERWPQFHRLTRESEEKIAALRDIPYRIVRLVNRLGYLAETHVYGHQCYIVRERHYAQARRLDGGTWPREGEKPLKTKDLWSSEGSFIGWHTMGPVDAPVLLVEGSIGILEGAAAIVAMDRDITGWSMMAATSCVSRFTAQDLHRLRGRRFRIVPDTDRAGLDACGHWAAALESAGCEVRVFELPRGAKDIGDVLKERETLTQIFNCYA